MVGGWLYGCGSIGCDPELPAVGYDDGAPGSGRRWKFGIGGPSGAGDSTPVVEGTKVAGPWDCIFVLVGGALIMVVGELLRWFIKRWRR